MKSHTPEKKNSCVYIQQISVSKRKVVMSESLSVSHVSATSTLYTLLSILPKTTF